MGDFFGNIEAVRKRARDRISEGVITEGYRADRVRVIALLNDVLATETVCALRYRRHYHMANGIASESVKREFLEHAHEEQEHADRVAERIVQLGGPPDFNPRGLAERSHAEYVEGADLRSMIQEDLIAERIAIETYTEIARWLGDGDPTTRRLMESILEKEEEHAEDLISLLGTLSDG